MDGQERLEDAKLAAEAASALAEREELEASSRFRKGRIGGGDGGGGGGGGGGAAAGGGFVERFSKWDEDRERRRERQRGAHGGEEGAAASVHCACAGLGGRGANRHGDGVEGTRCVCPSVHSRMTTCRPPGAAVGELGERAAREFSEQELELKQKVRAERFRRFGGPAAVFCRPANCCPPRRCPGPREEEDAGGRGQPSRRCARPTAVPSLFQETKLTAPFSLLSPTEWHAAAWSLRRRRRRRRRRLGFV